jgi:DNA-binding XRE family transcriptional regulator
MGKGGGGAPAPSQTTAYQTNLPEYAKPYVTSMLEATQRQLFNTQPGADGTTEITGFKPYQPYSTDPTKYFAGPSSLQQSTYGEAGRMQTPGQFGAATGLAGMSGMGQLGTTQQAGMYGAQGAGLGQQGLGIGQLGMLAAAPAFGAGQQFASQVTDPRSMQSYMSPYQQAVTDVAKNAAIREAQLAQQATNLGAARQGTYGGARQALMQGERERNLLANLSNIQAQGSQAAFDKAMQAQQFGANLGLQGIQTGLQGVQQGLAGTAQGMQGAGLGLQGVGAQQAGFAGAGQAASTLGNLGGAQQQADLARMGFQNQLGGQQQQYQQGIINQAIQDYATAQQYPMMQLGFMSNMLRGLPMQATTTQTYQAQPNLTTQAISGLGTAAGAYKAFGFKEGGEVKGLAAGGMGDRTGAAQQSEAAQSIKAQLMAMPEGQVAQVAQTSPSETVRAMANEVLIEKRMQKQAEQQAEASIAQDQAPRGLAAAPAPSMDAIGAATGGIVAFAGPEGSEVEEDDKYVQYVKEVQKAREAAGITGSPIDPRLKGMYEERLAGLPGRRESDTGLNMIDFFSRMNKPGSTLSAGIAAAGEALPGITARRKDLMAEELAATKGMSDLTLAERAEKLGVSKEALAAYEKDKDREKSLEVARIGAAPRDTDLDRTTAAELALLIEQGAPNNAATRAKARTIAIEKTGLALPKAAGAQEDRITKAWKEIDDQFFIEELKAVTPEEKAAVAAKKQAAKDEAARRLRTVIPTDTAPKKDDKVALGPNKDAGGKSVLEGAPLPETTTGPNGKKLYLHPDGMYRAYIPAGR